MKTKVQEVYSVKAFRIRMTNRVSILSSRIIAVVILACLLGLCFILPTLVKNFTETADIIGNRENLGDAERIIILTAAYVMIAVAAVAILYLWSLLTVVSQGDVFGPRTARLIRAVAICCFGEALLFLSIGYYFQLAIGVAMAAALVGLCLAVVKNVIAEASRIKAENDFTV